MTQQQAQRTHDAYKRLKAAAWELECLSTEFATFPDETRRQLHNLADQTAQLLKPKRKAA